MKKIYTIVTVILVTASVLAQAPQKMSYQAVIRNSSNALVTSKVVGMRISILKGSATATASPFTDYVETQIATTNANGLVSLEIGTGTPVTGTFSSINLSNGPYFIKTETDPMGGTNYTIVGTSELLSVPYALHAKTVENLSGINTGDQDLSGLATTSSVNSSLATKVDKETGKALSSNDYTTVEKNKLAAISGTNTGDQDLSGLATTSSVTSGLATKVDKVTGKDLLTDGTTPGQMNYWNGSAWVVVSPGLTGQTLTFVNGVPVWVGTPLTNVVVNPKTGKIWMDRNLGASQVATSSTDAASYGDLYQWGRGADGHQLRTSTTTATLSSTDVPGNANFILGSNDWRSSQNNNLWQGVNGVNNPCPSGFRIPTETELNTERLSWSTNNSIGAFESPLKLPLAGFRGFTEGSIYFVSVFAYYWSSTIGNNTESLQLHLQSDDARMQLEKKAYGFSVRCIKE